MLSTIEKERPMPQARHVPSVVPPFVRQILAYTMPSSKDGAKRFVSERNRESAEKAAREERETAELRAEIERQGEIARSFIPARSSASRTFATSSASRTRGGARPTLRPVATPPADDLGQRWAALHQTRATTSKKSIDSQAVYRAVNSKHDECGECGGHVEGPAHGLRSLNIKSAAPKARSLSQLAADVYGFAGGGDGPGLIAASSRGGF